MRYRPCAVLLVLAAADLAGAQVNIETYRGTAPVSGAARFSVSSDIGNVDAVRSDGAANLTLSRESGTLLAVLKGAAGFLGGKRYASTGVLHLRYTLTRGELFHPEVFAQGDYARARRLDSRSLAGLGGRWNVRRGDGLGLALGSAVMWERERLDLVAGDPHPGDTSEARFSTYVNLMARTGKGVSLSTTAYYQPALSTPDDARMLGTLELTTPIVGPLTQTTVVDFRVDTDPPRGVKDTDVQVSASFGVRFGD